MMKFDLIYDRRGERLTQSRRSRAVRELNKENDARNAASKSKSAMLALTVGLVLLYVGIKLFFSP